MNQLSGKPKTCKQCKDKFVPARTLQLVCSPRCGIDYANAQKARKEKEQEAKRRKHKAEWVEANRSMGWLTKKAQEAVNAYVRVRDYGKPCISCGTKSGTAWNNQVIEAGHYRAVGSAPHMRFVVTQINGQCVKCNRNLSGNVVEYRKGLINRIGEVLVVTIEHDNEPRKYTKDDLRRIAKIFRKRERLYKRLKGL